MLRFKVGSDNQELAAGRSVGRLADLSWLGSLMQVITVTTTGNKLHRSTTNFPPGILNGPVFRPGRPDSSSIASHSGHSTVTACLTASSVLFPILFSAE